MSAPVAAIDCGTNTIKLLVVSGDRPAARTLVRTSTVVRLGEGVDRTGRLAEQALDRTLAAVEEYAAVLADHDVGRVRFVATSAVRDAANADDLVVGVRDRLGVEPEVLSGHEEAALSFGGAVRDLDPDLPGPVLVVDVGGGSTELVLGAAPGGVGQGERRVTSSCSMDVGSVRLHERHDLADPPTPAQVSGVRADLEAALDSCPVPARQAATLVGVSGTVTSLAAGVLEVPHAAGSVHGRTVATAEVRSLVENLLGLGVAERLRLPWLDRGRADVIGVGGLILAAVADRVGADSIVVSEHDILDGLVWSLR